MAPAYNVKNMLNPTLYGNKAPILRVILLGDASVGKSSLIRRYVAGTFVELYRSTVGTDFFTKTLEVESKIVKLQVWDTSGDERFRMVQPPLYRMAHGIVLCYDVTQRSSFKTLSYWMEEIHKHADGHANVVLVGSKCDNCTVREVSVEEGSAFAESLGIPFSEVSARTDVNVEAVFDALVASILTRIAPPLVVFTLVSIVASKSSLQLSVAKLSGQTLDITLLEPNPSVEAACQAIAQACSLSPASVRLATLDGTLLDASDCLPVTGERVDEAGSSLRCAIQ